MDLQDKTKSFKNKAIDAKNKLLYKLNFKQLHC